MCLQCMSWQHTTFQQHTVTIDANLKDGQDDDAKLKVGRHEDVILLVFDIGCILSDIRMPTDLKFNAL